jgi:N-acetylglucosaminyl-diphospho-decaprenol L-rhamnosyltransferase
MVKAPTSADLRRRRVVVIVTHNHAGDIHECLSALSGEAVILIDNASSDGTASVAAGAIENIHVVANPRNIGFAAGANQGIALAGDADVVLVNPDIVVEPETLDRLAVTAVTRRAGLVVPRLTYPDGTNQESARAFPTLFHLLGRRTPLGRTAVGRRWRERSVPAATDTAIAEVDWAIGALMYLPRWSIDASGGFDERFFLYGEDVDLCARLWELGAPVLVDHRACAVHAYGRASKRTLDLRCAATRHHWASIGRLARRYPAQFFAGRSLQRPPGPGPGSPPASPPRPHLRGETGLVRLASERGVQMYRLFENWPLAALDRLGLWRGNRQVTYRLRPDVGGSELTARTNGCDVRTITEIWVGGFYDRNFVPTISTDRRPVVVDIGTNCGYFATYMATRWAGVRLICYEPEPTNRALAQRNLARNGVNADLRGEAVVAGYSPSVTLNLSDDPRLHTTVAPGHAQRQGIDSDRYSGRTLDVPAVNVNEVLACALNGGRIDLLKIDVEGIDLDLILAIEEKYLRSIDGIVAETEGKDTMEVEHKLESAGFHCTQDAGLLFARR